MLAVETTARRLNPNETANNSGIQKLVDAGALNFGGRGKPVQAWSAADAVDEAEGLVQRIGEYREDLLMPNARAHLSKRGLPGS